MTNPKPASLDWEDVRFFAAIAHHRTLAAAARALGVTQASVARRLASLESALGRPLFTRSGGGLALNTSGVAALAQAEEMDFCASAISVMAAHAPERQPTGASARRRRSSRQSVPGTHCRE